MGTDIVYNYKLPLSLNYELDQEGNSLNLLQKQHKTQLILTPVTFPS
jgi:hypothetical protein